MRARATSPSPVSDEVGRGCLAGPVTVGVVVVDPSAAASTARASGQQAADARAARGAWSRASSAGCSPARSRRPPPAEIDTYGIIAALRLAAHRALAGPARAARLRAAGRQPRLPDARRAQLAARRRRRAGPAEPDPVPLDRHPVVRTRIKADLTCASVAAASVLAKAVAGRVHGRAGRPSTPSTAGTSTRATRRRTTAPPCAASARRRTTGSAGGWGWTAPTTSTSSPSWRTAPTSRSWRAGTPWTPTRRDGVGCAAWT